MVYYFTSNVVSPPAQIYVGKDKSENEELIKYGLEEDFHVDNLSSAHIYLRLPGPSTSNTTSSSSKPDPNTNADAQDKEQETWTWNAIPAALLTDLAQLTKANSIEGNKKDNVTVIYTPWTNLKKDGSMAVGQVGFWDGRKVKKILVPARLNPIINRLNKTRIEKTDPDLRSEKEECLRQARKREQAKQQERKKEEARVARERKELAWRKDHAYDELFDEEEVQRSSNVDREEGWLDDFM